jgi:hypothetical protein
MSENLETNYNRRIFEIIPSLDTINTEGGLGGLSDLKDILGDNQAGYTPVLESGVPYVKHVYQLPSEWASVASDVKEYAIFSEEGSNTFYNKLGVTDSLFRALPLTGEALTDAQSFSYTTTNISGLSAYTTKADISKWFELLFSVTTGVGEELDTYTTVDSSGYASPHAVIHLSDMLTNRIVSVMGNNDSDITTIATNLGDLTTVVDTKTTLQLVYDAITGVNSTTISPILPVSSTKVFTTYQNNQFQTIPQSAMSYDAGNGLVLSKNMVTDSIITNLTLTKLIQDDFNWSTTHNAKMTADATGISFSVNSNHLFSATTSKFEIIPTAIEVPEDTTVNNLLKYTGVTTPTTFEVNTIYPYGMLNTKLGELHKLKSTAHTINSTGLLFFNGDADSVTHVNSITFNGNVLNIGSDNSLRLLRADNTGVTPTDVLKKSEIDTLVGTKQDVITNVYDFTAVKPGLMFSTGEGLEFQSLESSVLITKATGPTDPAVIDFTNTKLKSYTTGNFDDKENVELLPKALIVNHIASELANLPYGSLIDAKPSILESTRQLEGGTHLGYIYKNVGTGSTNFIEFTDLDLNTISIKSKYDGNDLRLKSQLSTWDQSIQAINMELKQKGIRSSFSLTDERITAVIESSKTTDEDGNPITPLTYEEFITAGNPGAGFEWDTTFLGKLYRTIANNSELVNRRSFGFNIVQHEVNTDGDDTAIISPISYEVDDFWSDQVPIDTENEEFSGANEEAKYAFLADPLLYNENDLMPKTAIFNMVNKIVADFLLPDSNNHISQASFAYDDEDSGEEINVLVSGNDEGDLETTVNDYTFNPEVVTPTNSDEASTILGEDGMLPEVIVETTDPEYVAPSPDAPDYGTTFLSKASDYVATAAYSGSQTAWASGGFRAVGSLLLHQTYTYHQPGSNLGTTIANQVATPGVANDYGTKGITPEDILRDALVVNPDFQMDVPITDSQYLNVLYNQFENATNTSGTLNELYMNHPPYIQAVSPDTFVDGDPESINWSSADFGAWIPGSQLWLRTFPNLGGFAFSKSLETMYNGDKKGWVYITAYDSAGVDKSNIIDSITAQDSLVLVTDAKRGCKVHCSFDVIDRDTTYFHILKDSYESKIEIVNGIETVTTGVVVNGAQFLKIYAIPIIVSAVTGSFGTHPAENNIAYSLGSGAGTGVSIQYIEPSNTSFLKPNFEYKPRILAVPKPIVINGSGTDQGAIEVQSAITAGKDINVINTTTGVKIEGDLRYTNLNPTPIAVGGIPKRSTFNSLTMKQMFDKLLYPVIKTDIDTFTIDTK